MKPVYIALIVIGCLIAAAGVGVGIYFGIKASQSTSSTSPTTTCPEGGAICGTICCNSSLDLGKGCICTDSCANVGSYNGDVFCCKDKDFPNAVDDQCCSSATPPTCQAGTPLKPQ
jgi:hypothetical protein